MKKNSKKLQSPLENDNLGVKFLGPLLSAGIVPKSPYIACANFLLRSEDFRRNGGKITENRRYSGVDGRFSAVNRR